MEFIERLVADVPPLDAELRLEQRDHDPFGVNDD